MYLVEIIYFISVFLLILWAEYYNRRSFKELLFWIERRKIAVIMNYLTFISISLLTQSILNNMYLRLAITSFLLLFLSIISMYKVRYRGDSLFPWDLGLGKESSSMSNFFSDIGAIINIALIITFPILILFLGLVEDSHKLSWSSRLIVGIISVMILIVISFRPSKVAKFIFRKLNLNYDNKSQAETYYDNGFLLSFFMNIKKLFIFKPNDYSEKKVKAIISEQEKSIEKKDTPVVKPNVIIIMNESFWDPTLLNDVNFAKDPLPTFHSLSKKHSHGYLVSPELGGGTSNVEFEILTGNSMNFLPTGSMAFKKYLKHPVTSLATIFKDNGYQTLGLHSYKRWFWNRDVAYELLGFDKFISCEDFANPEYKGTYISDEAFSRKVIEEKEKINKPLFMYGVTMQNHGPYSDNRYGETEIKINANNLSDLEIEELRTYTQGVHDADKSLKILIDYFSKSDEPTVIVFFGDHLPMLGKNFSIFKKTGFIGSTNSVDWSKDEKLKMHSVPLVVWSNYKEEVPLPNHLSTVYFGSILLDYVKIKKPQYFNYIYNLSKEIPILHNKIDISYMNDNHRKFIENEKRNYWILEYDQLFGKDYLGKL